MTAPTSDDERERGGGHGTSGGTLLLVLIVLLVLAALSFGLRFADLGTVGIPVALVIAAVKAVLVVVFFMELRDEPPTVRLAFISGLALFALMVALVVADVVTRVRVPNAPPPTAESRARG
jgi:cytochrome c oxidase subunit 4